MIASRRDATAPWVIRALARDLPGASYDARRPIAQVRNDIMAAARPRVTIARDECACPCHGDPFPEAWDGAQGSCVRCGCGIDPGPDKCGTCGFDHEDEPDPMEPGIPRVTVALDETAETAEFLARVTGHAFEPDADRDGSCYCGAPRYATRHLDAYGRPLSGDEELPFDGRFDSNGELI